MPKNNIKWEVPPPPTTFVAGRPPSLMSKDDIKWEAPPPPTYDYQSPIVQDPPPPTLKPYLRLPHLLSLTWLAYPVISLIFVAFRLQLSLASAQDGITSAKNDLLASCTAAEKASTATASMPRYMSLAMNKQFADAVNGSLDSARDALILSLTVMEAIIDFIIDIYRSTLLCFLELAVNGSLSLVASVVGQLNTVTQGVASGLSSSISNANSAINAINKVDPIKKMDPIPDSSLAALQNLTLPDSFQQSLTTLQGSVPSVSTIKQVIDDFVNTPFELMKGDINQAFANLTFNASLLPVPDENQLSFCDNALNIPAITNIERELVNIGRIGMITLIGLALLIIGLNCILVWYKWRSMRKNFENTRQAWRSDPTVSDINLDSKSSPSTPQVQLTDHNLMILKADAEHPLFTKIANLLANRFRMTPAQHIKLRWFLHYVFHPPALACFLIGFFGLLSVQIQLLVMGPMLATARASAYSAVSDFSDIISNSMNQSMYNQSSLYASQINSKVAVVQSTINESVFGWVNITTTTISTAVNTFYTEVQTLVSDAFNGTILETPANDLVNCVIGSKVAAVDAAVAFLQNNLKVTIPAVDPGVLVLSPQAINEATAPIASAAIGGGAGGNQGVLGRVVDTYEASLRTEALVFSAFMGLWVFVVLEAICILWWEGRKVKKQQ